MARALAAAFPPPHRRPALEHGFTDGRGDRGQRGYRDGCRLPHRADGPPRPAGVVRAPGTTGGRARLRHRLGLDIPVPVAAGAGGRLFGTDPGPLPPRLPPGGGEPAQHRPRSRRSGPEPRPRPSAHVLVGDLAPGPPGPARRVPPGGPVPAGRVRRLFDPALPDLHDRDLHRVPDRLQHPGRVRPVPGARRAGPRRARRGRPLLALGAPGPAPGPRPPPRPRPVGKSEGGGRGRRCRRRGPGPGRPGVGDLLLERLEPTQRVAGRLVPGRRGLAHRPLQRRCRRRRHGGGPSRGHPRRPPPGTPGPGPGTGVPARPSPPRPGSGLGLGLFCRALRPFRVPERSPAGGRLCGDVLPPGTGGGAGLGGPGPGGPGGGGPQFGAQAGGRPRPGHPPARPARAPGRLFPGLPDRRHRAHRHPGARPHRGPDPGHPVLGLHQRVLLRRRRALRRRHARRGRGAHVPPRPVVRPPAPGGTR